MQKWAFLAVVAVASAGQGCGPTKDSAANPASLRPEYATIVESVISLLANQVPTASGGNCVITSCTPHSGGATYYAQAPNCRTEFGSIDGTLYLQAENIPELNGCTTRTGPFSFRQWPPSRGRIAFAIGRNAFDTNEIPTSAPPITFDRVDTGKSRTRNWGKGALVFSGNSKIQVVFDHQVERDKLQLRLHASSDLFMHTQSPWDSSERILTGSFALEDVRDKTMGSVWLANVAYRKPQCCHPLSGTLTLSINLSPDPAAGAARFILSFSPICGQADLQDELGQSSQISLPGCSVINDRSATDVPAL